MKPPALFTKQQSDYEKTFRKKFQHRWNELFQKRI